MKLVLTNCSVCGLELIYPQSVCKICKKNIAQNKLLEKQKKLWIKHVYNPWKRAKIKEWKQEDSITITP